MAYLFGDNRLEKLGLAKRLDFVLGLTLNSGAAPTLASVSAPAGASIIGIVTADGAGTLCPGITFASTAPTSSTAPVIGLEIADGMFQGTTAQVLYAKGVVTAVTGANINKGSPVYSTAVYASPGQGVGYNLQFGLAGTITGLAQTISGANGTLSVALTVVYLDRG